ncbi:uncharacterized protein LOC114753707 [Neltuma alba]|uniref:uncharacterized protein LOC114753707 n=1 Tax=Neltuma alba TaxID=207710 RepID=UPI0010A2D001|nr:uncharacterized protein LOC114753707 [Prosopis alba]
MNRKAERGMREESSKQEEANTSYDDDEQQVCTPRVSCGCFLVSDGYTLFHHQSNDDQENEQQARDNWWHRQMKKMKTDFLRYRANKKARRLRFHYDPKSYALNFDDAAAAHNTTSHHHAAFVISH